MSRPKFFLFLFILLNSSLFGWSNNDVRLDSIFSSLSQLPKSEQIQELIKISATYRNSSYAQSLKIGQRAIALAEGEGKPELLARSYKNQGVNYLMQGNLDSSLLVLEKALPQFKKAGLRLDMAKVYGNMGIVYRRKGLSDKSLEMYLKNLEIYKEEKNEMGIGVLSLNIGGLYQDLGFLIEAKKHYLLALEILGKYEQDQRIVQVLNNLGLICEELKDYDNGLEYYEDALTINESLKNNRLEALVRMNRGKILSLQEEYDKALKDFEIAQSIYSQLGDEWGMIQLWQLKGQCHEQMGKLQLALLDYGEAEEGAKRMDLSSVLVDIYMKSVEIYKKQKNYFLAYQYLFQVTHLRDSLDKITNQEQFQNLQVKYEADKRQRELEIQQLALGKRNAWLFGLVVLIVLGGVAIAVSFRINRMRAEHQIMSLRQRVLLTQMNPHFLFNSLTAIQSFILDERNMEANSYLSQLASLVRGVLENSREEFIPLSRELETLEDYLSLQNLRFDNQLGYHFEIDPELDQDEVAIPPMLAQPFIENAIKHGELRNNPQARIDVRIARSNNPNSLLFEITDNGIGINESLKRCKDPKHNSLATSIAKDRVKIYNYREPQSMKFNIVDLQQEDPQLHGTRVTFYIPYKRI